MTGKSFRAAEGEHSALAKKACLAKMTETISTFGTICKDEGKYGIVIEDQIRKENAAKTRMMQVQVSDNNIPARKLETTM